MYAIFLQGIRFLFPRHLYKKIASNTLFQVLTKVCTALISILLLSILTKNLSVEYFGIYNKVFQYLGIFIFLADLWLYTIAIREIGKYPKNTEKIIGNILSLRLVLASFIWWVALIIASFLPWFSSSLVLWSIFIVWAFSFVSLINSSLLALMQSQMKMEFSFISTVSGKILNLIAVSVVCMYMLDVWEGRVLLCIFTIATLSLIVTTYMNYLYARNICSIRLLWDREYIYHIFRISLPYGIALFLSVVYFKIDVIMLWILEWEGANTSIALYSLPMKIIEVLMVVWGFYLNSLLPTLTQKIHNHISEVQEIVRLSCKFLGSLGICIYVFSVLFWWSILTLIATPEYLTALPFNSYDVFILSSGVLLFHFLALIFIYLLIAKEQQSQLLKINAIITCVNIALNSILIPQFSFYWAGIATLISQALLCMICYGSIGRMYISFLRLWQSIIPSILLGVSIYVLGIFLIERMSFGDVGNMFLLAPLLFCIYLWWEYLLFTRSRH